NEIDINWLGFKTNASYKSLAFVWYKQLTMKIMDEPNNYSKQKIEEIYNKYSEISRNINQSRANNISNQTVIFILSESFFNPLRIPGTEISNDILNNISEISLNSTSGTMKSDGYGGGTANMEFQALTGLPYYNFSSSVTTIYTEVVPEMTSIPSISDNFSKENRFVLHPSDANNYDRKDIYEKLDFSSLIFQFNSEKSFENIKTQGISISDETVYNNVLLELDSEKSQFFSIITMQNHAPWSEEYPKELTAINSNLSDEENEKLTNYVRLLSYTDVATANFIRSLEEVEKDITVVFYGDHLPGFYPQHIFNESPEIQYQTDYFIWSNFETNSKSNNNFINSSDFIASLFETTNSKVSPYYALLTEVMNHATINKINLTKAEQIIADDLKLIQYDITIGDGYIFEFEDFFNIKSED
ncbi:TPA: LTA synthase family protein, partial [Streptococcus suis]